MVKTTKAQRLALKRVFDREPLPGDGSGRNGGCLTYRQFRKRVRAGPDCIMVPWCGMWLGIEPDGYTHS